MSSHRARGNTSSRFNLQNECYFPRRLCLVQFFQSACFTVNPPVRGAKVNDGLPQPDVTSYSALIRKKAPLFLGFSPRINEVKIPHEPALCLTLHLRTLSVTFLPVAASDSR